MFYRITSSRSQEIEVSPPVALSGLCRRRCRFFLDRPPNRPSRPQHVQVLERWSRSQLVHLLEGSSRPQHVQVLERWSRSKLFHLLEGSSRPQHVQLLEPGLGVDGALPAGVR